MIEERLPALSSKKLLRLVLGIKLRQLRNAAGLSLKQLAQDTGLSHSYLNEIEKGKKYPKREKLGSLAKKLGVNVEYLISVRMRNSIKPLAAMLERDVFSALPLEVFGMSEQDIFDLMSQSPEKFTAFVMTVVEMSRAYGFKLEDFHQAALRSYIERHKNYFPKLEATALQARQEALDQLAQDLSSQALARHLESEWGYLIDDQKLGANAATKSLQAVSQFKERPVLLLNSSLSEERKRLILAYELGKSVLKMPKILWNKDDFEKEKDFSWLMGNFQANYFARAFLLDEDLLSAELAKFFHEKTFHPELFLNLAQKFLVGHETLVQRTIQLLPAKFGLENMFFLRFKGKLEEGKPVYKASKELHFSQLHNPHGVNSKETYCPKWITIRSMQKLLNSPQAGSESFSAQRSIMPNGQGEYLCLSLAKRPSNKKDQAISLTIGIKASELAKKTIAFFDDPAIPNETVGQTCERCPMRECAQRARPATLLKKLEKAKARRLEARRLLDGVYSL